MGGSNTSTLVPSDNNLIEEVLKQVEHLPTLPHVVLRVMEMTQSPNVNIDGISAALDQSLAAMVLKMANSVYYGGGRSRNVNSIRHAIVIIGFDALKEIVLTASFFHTFHDARDVQSLQPLWEHSQSAAQIAKRLAWIYGYSNLDEAYFGGLVHDVGKLVLQQYFPDQYRMIQELIQKGSEEVDAEKATIGLNHAEIGGKVCDFWGFPGSLADAISHHHDDHWQVNPKLGMILGGADRFVLGLYDFKKVLHAFSQSEMFPPKAWDESDLESVEKILKEELLKAQALFTVSNHPA